MEKYSSEHNAKQNAKITELVRKVKEGDKEAFETLYDCTWKSVHYILARNIHDETDTMILLNEVYVEAYTCIQSLECDKAFMKWITRIAYIRCVEFLKVRYKLSVEEPMGDSVGADLEEEDDDLIPEKALINQEVREVILRAIEKLPPAQRDTVFMFYYHNLSVAEIADVTDCPENTVYKRLHDAKKSLKVRLSHLMTKGASLYGMTDFYVLREIFQKDIDDYAARVSQAASWAAIAGQIGVAAPVAARGVGTAATAATQAVGTAAANAALVKTVILGAIAATVATTGLVAREKFFMSPDEFELAAVVQGVGDLENMQEVDAYGEADGDLEILEGSQREVYAPEAGATAPIGEPSPSPRATATQGERVVIQTEPVATAGANHREDESGQRGAAYEAVQPGWVDPRLGAVASTSAEPSPLPQASEEIEPPTEITQTEEALREETNQSVHEPSIGGASSGTELIENNLSSTPKPTSTATPRPAVSTEKPEPPQSGGGDSGSGGGNGGSGNQSGGGNPGTPGYGTIYFQHVYEINSAPEGDAVIGDIAVYSGDMFVPGVDTVMVLENNFDRGRVGSYTVRLYVVRANNGGAFELNATLTVVDIEAPVIEVANPIVTLDEGERVSPDEILLKAGAVVTDNSGEGIDVVVSGFDEIDFNAPGQYILELKAQDSQGNEAAKRVVIVNVVA